MTMNLAANAPPSTENGFLGRRSIWRRDIPGARTTYRSGYHGSRRRRSVRAVSGVLSPDRSNDTLVSSIYTFWRGQGFMFFSCQTFQAPYLGEDRAKAKNVAAIILGGGAGTKLFPLTSRRSEPAVSPKEDFLDVNDN